jgi:hypothetical protein
MEASLARDFQYPLATAAKQLLESAGAWPAYPREVPKFDVSEIRVTSDAVLLLIDFRLRVR